MILIVPSRPSSLIVFLLFWAQEFWANKLVALSICAGLPIDAVNAIKTTGAQLAVKSG